MKFSRIYWINFIQVMASFVGISGLLFLPPQTLDYLDAEEYCASVDGVLCDLEEAMTARNKCVLTTTDVWYKRKKTDPDIGSPLPYGMCYVYGSYWQPCKDKLWFFCYDQNENDSSISCTIRPPVRRANFLHLDDVRTFGDEDYDHLDIELAKYNSNSTPRVVSRKRGLSAVFIDFNIYEVAILAGTAIVSILVTLICVAIVMRCRKPASKKVDDYEEPTVHLRKSGPPKKEAKMYETTRETMYIPHHIYEATEKVIYDVPTL